MLDFEYFSILMFIFSFPLHKENLDQMPPIYCLLDVHMSDTPENTIFLEYVVVKSDLVKHHQY